MCYNADDMREINTTSASFRDFVENGDIYVDKTEYIYVGDRWLDPGLPESKTILLPLEFEENGELILNYRDSWQLNLKKKDWR